MKKISEEYFEEIQKSVEKAKEKISLSRSRHFVLPKNPVEELEDFLKSAIRKTFSQIEPNNLEIRLENPPLGIQSDYAWPAFSLSEKLKKSPLEIAEEISREINQNPIPEIKKAEASGPYLNLICDWSIFYPRLLKYFSESGENFGKSDINSGKTAVFDLSSPNIAKPLSVGHLRSTVIGNALANIYEYTGCVCIKYNYLGDWGTQFGKLIYAYQKWGDEKIVEKNPIEELRNLYVRFHKESEGNSTMEEDARKIFSALENGDENLLMLWKKFCDWSLTDFAKIYEKIGIDFDLYIGESYFSKDAEKMVDHCLKSGICKQDENSLAVSAEIDGLPSFLLRKNDGSTIYLSRDLATLKFRMENFQPDFLVYVVGNEQELNFKQLFALAEKIGYLPKNVSAKHIGFGMVLMDGKKMSTRQGTVIELKEVFEKAEIEAEKIIRENQKEFEEEEISEIKKTIGVGAIIYNDLKQSRIRNISFDWNKMLKLEAGTSAYLQYAGVRINSIFKKLQERESDFKNVKFENKSELLLTKKIAFFPRIIQATQKTDSPHLLCVYLEELAQQFSSFYADSPILNAEKNLLLSRISLIKACSQTLKNGLEILGIKIPPKM